MNSSAIPPFALPLKNRRPDPEWELLFPEGVPRHNSADDHAEIITNPEAAEQAGYLDRHIADPCVPQMLAYPIPSGRPNTGNAVLICPGGGYRNLAFDKEGTDMARFFNSIGYAAFVLKYHMSGSVKKPGVNPYGPLRDAQRAMRLIRSRAEQYRLRPDRIGIMGFSAGGHLAATVSTRFNDNAETDPRLAAVSSRPDFTILVYPVIALEGTAAHLGSSRNLLGDFPDSVLLRRFSPVEQADHSSPPAFLVQTQDDAVSVENSVLYYMALCRSGVKAEMHLYPEGGHGYGLRRRGLAIDIWPQHLKDWLGRTFS